MKTYRGVEIQLHTFLTLALDGGEWSASHPSHFTPEKRALVPTIKEAGWNPELVWTWWQREKFLVLARIRTLVIQLIAWSLY
jgi:hypothetical protein